jgi:hypothetical protein
VKRVYPWFLLIAVAALVLRFPFIGLGLVGLIVVALVSHRLGRHQNLPFDKDLGGPGGPNTADFRTDQAMALGGWEMGETAILEDGMIQAEAPWGLFRVCVQYQDLTPYILLHLLKTEETEMVFILRRRQSSLDLPPVVSNTPIRSSAIEYQLRKIPLDDALQTHFDGATNRPRLFRELLDAGLANEVVQLLEHTRYRLEDLVFDGQVLTVIIHPAADPGESPYIADCLELAQPIVKGMIHFLEKTTIPSARH